LDAEDNEQTMIGDRDRFEVCVQQETVSSQHEDNLRLLDDLDVDIGNDPNMMTNSDSTDESNGEQEPEVTVVDEHDYARGAKCPRRSSVSYSSVDDFCSNSGSGSPSSKFFSLYFF
jgi:hypothetical protein